MILRRPKPIEDDLAVIHSPAAVAARRKRLEKQADELIEAHGAPGPQPIALNPLAMIAFRAGTVAMSAVTMPLAYDGHVGQLRPAQVRATEQEIQRRFRALVVQELEVNAIAAETSAIYNAPDRMEYARVMAPWDLQVNAIAFQRGNKIDVFVGQVRDLLRQRDDAAEYDDEPAVRAIEARLNKLTGVPFPQLPESAFQAAELLPAAEREAEVARLDAKYKTPSTNGTAPETRSRRLRPLASVGTN